MKDDVQCPYCGAYNEINHDDGYGYGEDGIYNQKCRYCAMAFAYTTSITFDYNAQKADCLNDGMHKWEPQLASPKEYSIMFCPDCGGIRPCTELELKEIFR